VGSLTEAQVAEAVQRAKGVLTLFPQIKWVRTFYAAEEGKMYCEYEAPAVDLVYEHAKLAHVPVDSIATVTELLPAMYR